MAEPDDSTRDPFQLCGTTIEGKYRVASVVGDGGFGVVYRGIHTGFGEPIAVKCLKLPLELDAKQREGFLEQLRDEGRLLHRLSKATPGIVQALDVGAVTTPAGWVPYLVLEWLEGETLADHLAKRAGAPYPLEEAIRLLEPAARALATAHALKVAHRDVKPHNLFVAEVGGTTTLKVLDFGIAKVLTDYPTFTEALVATRAAPAAFTPRYGAPEQFNKMRGASGPWTDVFALGLILVELLTGKKALEGDDPTQLYVAAADPALRPTPRVRGVTVPEPVEGVLAKALAVEPKDRYADAGEFLDALLGAAGLAAAVPTVKPASVKALPVATPLSSKGPPATVVEGRGRPSATLETDPTEVAGSPPPGSPGASKARPTATVASPGAPPKPAVDPMSETPFFERHHLPRSGATVAREAAAAGEKPAGEKAPAADRPGRSWGRMVLLAVLVGGTAAAIAYLGEGPQKGPRPAQSGVVLTTPILPTRKSAGPGGVSASGAAPRASAELPPRASAEPSVVPPDMVYVAAGTVAAGDADGGQAVTVARPFYLDRTEVTVHAYAACVAKRQCTAADHLSLPSGAGARFSPPVEEGSDAGAAEAGATSAAVAAYVDAWSRHCNAPRGADGHPINCVDFAGADAYCRWAGKRLPTEAEWALAARGGGAEPRAYPWGSDAPECDRACYDKNDACRAKSASAVTCATGLHLADRTPEGVHDLGGNVAEWVSDGADSLRVVRGGSFIDGADALKATTRAVVPAALAHVGIGFRCALDAPGTGQAPPPEAPKPSAQPAKPAAP